MKKEFDYTLVGDVYLPNLISTDTNYEIGIWGQRHRDYLKQYHRVRYYNLLTSDKLNSYLHDIDELAQVTYEKLMEIYVQKEGITEEMKNLPNLVWVRKINNIKQEVIEIINKDIIYK